MKKNLILLAACMFALPILNACSDDEEEDPVVPDTGYDEAYYADLATVGSDDPRFTATDGGGEIRFEAEGGEVVVGVSCGVEWIAENTASDLFSTSLTSTSLTVTAGRNAETRELAGTITLRTAERRIAFATISLAQEAYNAPEISVEADEWHAPAVGALTVEFAVEATADWTAESADPWLTAEKVGDGIRLTADENEGSEERSTWVRLTCSDDVSPTYDYITVVQDGRAHITVGEGTVYLGSGEGSSSVTVESNFDWDYSIDTGDGWFTITRFNDILTVTAAANETDGNREGSVVLTAGDGAENVTEVSLGIVQMGSSEDNMVITFTIPSANTSTNLPLGGTVDCMVDWGDGTVERITSAQPAHTYASAGEYDATIMGTVTALNDAGIALHSHQLNITAVKQWGRTGLTSMAFAFGEVETLSSLPEVTGDAFENVESFEYAFYFCALETLPDDLFHNCPKATTFEWCLASNWYLKKLPEPLFIDCPLATNFEAFCFDCSVLEAIPRELFKPCPEVTTFKDVFGWCSAITEVPDDLFDYCPKVTNLQQVFQADHLLESVPENIFAKCPEVTTFFYVFNRCYALKEIPVGIFDNNKKVENFREAFAENPDLGGESPYTIVDGKKVHIYERDESNGFVKPTTISKCFYECTSLDDYDDIPDDWK